MKFDDKRMRDLLHDVSLNLRVVDLVGLDDKVLLERLDGIYNPRILLPSHVDLAEGAATDHL